MRVLVRGEGGVMICRDYEVACGMACLSSTHAAIEEFRARFGAEPTDVVVDRHQKDKRRGPTTFRARHKSLRAPSTFLVFSSAFPLMHAGVTQGF